MIPTEQADRQFQRIGVDLLEWDNKQFHVLVDYHSGYFEVDELPPKATAAVCIKVMKRHFARYGIPEVCISDNGPQYHSAEFQCFSKEWDFEHVTISPYHSKANGKVEAAVKITKNILRKSKEDGSDPLIALLEIHNTPSQDLESSPVQQFLNRRTRTLLPVSAKLLAPRGEDILKYDKNKLWISKCKSKKLHDRTVRDLKPLEEQDTVWMKPYRLGEKTWTKATVLGRLDERSYRVEADDRAEYRRNRVDLRKSTESPCPNSSAVQSQECAPPLHLKRPAGATADPCVPQGDCEDPVNNDMPWRPKRQTSTPARFRDFQM
ncbi:Uncharacterised protein r2_g3935 [Pycnogonum litorale]